MAFIAAGNLFQLRSKSRRRSSGPRKPKRKSDPAASGEESEEVSPDLLQQFTRLRTEDGGESIHALVRAHVPAGERLAVVHLALCPPLETTPKLTAHTIDSEAEVKITQAETYGLRLEVRLPDTDTEPRQIVVEVLGEASPLPVGRGVS